MFQLWSGCLADVVLILCVLCVLGVAVLVVVAVAVRSECFFLVGAFGVGGQFCFLGA